MKNKRCQDGTKGKCKSWLQTVRNTKKQQRGRVKRTREDGRTSSRRASTELKAQTISKQEDLTKKAQYS